MLLTLGLAAEFIAGSPTTYSRFESEKEKLDQRPLDTDSFRSRVVKGDIGGGRWGDIWGSEGLSTRLS
jgi:hypothetical protein